MAARLFALVCGGLALLGLPRSAEANGRFPRAERIVENPTSSDELMLAATYGILRSEDRGETWSYICEASFAGSDAYSGDPLLTILGDSTAVVNVQSDLVASRDHGCSWPSILNAPGVLDFTVQKGTPDTLIALIANIEDGGLANVLESSSDLGAHWTRLGVVPVATAYTVDVAPSNPLRVYVSGSASDNSEVLLTSDDGGKSFVSHPITSARLGEQAYIAAVDPKNADHVFIRSDAWPSEGGTRYGDDALIYSPDAGKTFQELIRKGAKLYGFALSPDDSSVLIGYGAPTPVGIPNQLETVDPTVLGLYRSANGPFSFERFTQEAISCLTWSSSGVYVCASRDGKEILFSPGGLPDDAGAFTTLLDRSKIMGPIADCTQGKGACDLAWQTACLNFAASCGDGGLVSDASAPGDASIDGAAAGGATAGGGGTAGSGGAPGSAGTTATAGGSDTTGAGDAASPSSKSNDCGCRVVGSPAASLARLLAIALGVALVRRRRFRMKQP